MNNVYGSTVKDPLNPYNSALQMIDPNLLPGSSYQPNEPYAGTSTGFVPNSLNTAERVTGVWSKHCDQGNPAHYDHGVNRSGPEWEGGSFANRVWRKTFDPAPKEFSIEPEVAPNVYQLDSQKPSQPQASFLEKNCAENMGGSNYCKWVRLEKLLG